MRADVYLTENGYAVSRRRAQELIAQGLVSVDGKTLTKASADIKEGEHDIRMGQDPLRYVGRGGQKLEAALAAFGLDVRECVALDIGASTGGFTDCLLQHGAAHVCAVDAGYGQLSPKLLQDARVRSLEKTNARELTLEQIGGERVDVIVMDVSFISATYILPRFRELLKEGGHAVCLIKPQFEVGRASLAKGGIVKDPSAHRAAVERVCAAAEQVGLETVEVIPSPIVGGDGNREFLAHFVFRDACLR